MDTTSFNLLLLNLIIGLIRNHPFYRPLSGQIKSHDYELFGVERSFKCGARDLTPEIMACSDKNKHTVLLESTSLGGLNNKKRTQLEWYLRVASGDLINSAGVTADSAQSHSLWVVVTPDALAEYREILDWETTIGLMLSSFSADPTTGYSLTYSGGEFKDADLGELLTPLFQTSRIYQGYVTIDTSNLAEKVLVKPIMQRFVSAVVKDELEIKAENIARSLIKVWSSYDPAMRTAIVKSVNKVLRKFSLKPYTEKMLVGQEKPEPLWVVTLPPNKEAASSKAKLYRAAARYQSELSSGFVQLDFDL